MRDAMSKLLTLVVCGLVISQAKILLKTPPMGWNSWNHFGCDGLNEDVVKAAANTLVSNGLAELGYVYVNLDDCWQSHRNKSGFIQANSTTFPSGIGALSDFVHSKGLKFGIYTDRGDLTCQQKPGSFGYEKKDATMYAEWKVDFLKNDDCFIPDEGDAHVDYGRMETALQATGRDIVHSIKWKEPLDLAPLVSQMRRVTNWDISDNWDAVSAMLDASIGLAEHATKGFWNDMDMLEVGNGGMAWHEYKAHFSLWCLLKSPLLLGNDLEHMSKQAFDIVSNEELIAINQDSLGKQGMKIDIQGESLEVWAAETANNTVAIALLNRSGGDHEIHVTWEMLGLPSDSKCELRDLWQKKDLGVFTSKYSTAVPLHDVVMLSLKPLEANATFKLSPITKASE